MVTGLEQLSGKKVAVLDDIRAHRVGYCAALTRQGNPAIPLERRFNSVDEVVKEVQGLGVYGVLCDLRLSEGNYARGFDGAQATAALYDARMPAVLATNYWVEEANYHIRQFRRWIPVLLKAGEASPLSIMQGLCECRRELDGDIPVWRRSRRAMVIVRGIESLNSEDELVRAEVPQWRPDTLVGFPKRIIPPEMHAEIRPSAMFIAGVNIDAEEPADLYFEKFELAPSPGESCSQ